MKKILMSILWIVYCGVFAVLGILQVADIYTAPNFLKCLLHSGSLFVLAQLVENKKWVVALYVLSTICFVFMIVALLC